jgi:DNA transformation protein
MPAWPELVAHAVELLAPAGRVQVRSMFGGHGLYVDGLFVAIVAFDRLYLKADTATRERFVAAGCAPFVYQASGRQVALGYFTAPDDAMESPALMQPWARLAIDAAVRARAAKPAARAKRPRASRR